jgi:hypothetical protein
MVMPPTQLGCMFANALLVSMAAVLGLTVTPMKA